MTLTTFAFVADVNITIKHGSLRAHSVQLRALVIGDPGPSSVGDPWLSGTLSDGVAKTGRTREKFIAEHDLPPDATAHVIELLRVVIPEGP